jgi:hypothetical protein
MSRPARRVRRPVHPINARAHCRQDRLSTIGSIFNPALIFAGGGLHELSEVSNLPSVAKAFSYGFYTGGRADPGRRRMPRSELRVPVEAIRREAELARNAVSLRQTAREIGITPMGLRYFLLNQGKQQARTVRKLNEWYVRRMATRPPQGEDEARAALTILAGFYPQSERFRVLNGFLDSMEREFRDSGMEPPAWLATLRAELERDPD